MSLANRAPRRQSNRCRPVAELLFDVRSPVSSCCRTHPNEGTKSVTSVLDPYSLLTTYATGQYDNRCIFLSIFRSVAQSRLAVANLGADYGTGHPAVPRHRCRCFYCSITHFDQRHRGLPASISVGDNRRRPAPDCDSEHHKGPPCFLLHP